MEDEHVLCGTLFWFHLYLCFAVTSILQRHELMRSLFDVVQIRKREMKTCALAMELKESQRQHGDCLEKVKTTIGIFLPACCFANIVKREYWFILNLHFKS